MKDNIYRSRTIVHPNGTKFDTPLLVPSFSSKGFSLMNRKDLGVVSECYDVMMVAKGFLHESLLVSAYDLYYNLIPKPSEFNSTKINIIDSGGYETSQVYDLSGINKNTREVKEWSLEFLIDTLSKWPEDMTSIIVSYDHGKLRKPILEQVEDAQDLFHRNKNFMSNFLIKPETREQDYINLSNIITDPNLLSGFDIVGVTEKEIGNSQLERMINIALLRRAMDVAGVNSPIHIFGSLDPINIILYFLAGAEVFDGLTWLKFAYHKGAAIYIQNYSVLSNSYGIETNDMQLKRNFWVDNISFLTKLKAALINFSIEKKYENFHDIDNGLYNLSATIEKLHTQFLNKLKSK